jgi:hypothetical protein
MDIDLDKGRQRLPGCFGVYKEVNSYEGTAEIN